MDGERPTKGIVGELQKVVQIFLLLTRPRSVLVEQETFAIVHMGRVVCMLATKNSISASVGSQAKNLITAWAISRSSSLFSLSCAPDPIHNILFPDLQLLN